MEEIRIRKAWGKLKLREKNNNMPLYHHVIKASQWWKTKFNGGPSDCDAWSSLSNNLIAGCTRIQGSVAEVNRSLGWCQISQRKKCLRLSYSEICHHLLGLTNLKFAAKFHMDPIKKKNNPLTAGTFQDWEIFKTYFSSYMRDLHEIYGVKMADMQHSSW